MYNQYHVDMKQISLKRFLIILLLLLEVGITVFLVQRQQIRADESIVLKTADELQAQIDQLSLSGGGVVLLDPGVYILNHSLVLKPNITLQGYIPTDGDTKQTEFRMDKSFTPISQAIYTPDSQNVYVMVQIPHWSNVCADNVEIKNIYFNGDNWQDYATNKAALTRYLAFESTQEDLFPHGFASPQLAIMYCGNHVEISHNKFTGFTGGALKIGQVSQAEVAFNIFDNIHSLPVGSEYGDIYFGGDLLQDIRLHDNRFLNIESNIVAFNTGPAPPEASSSATPRIGNIDIRNNIAGSVDIIDKPHDPNGMMGIWFIGNGLIDNLHIEDNAISNIHSECIASYGVKMQNVVIKNNTLTNCDFDGIVITGQADHHNNNIEISDNTIHWEDNVNGGFLKGCGVFGIWIQNIDGITVRHNTLSNYYNPYRWDDTYGLTGLVFEGNTPVEQVSASCRGLPKVTTTECNYDSASQTTTVHLVGTNFSGQDSFRLLSNGRNMQVPATSWTNTQITGTFNPPLPPGQQTLYLTDPSGKKLLDVNDYRAVSCDTTSPHITHISCELAPDGIRTNVGIDGSNFTTDGTSGATGKVELLDSAFGNTYTIMGFGATVVGGKNYSGWTDTAVGGQFNTILDPGVTFNIELTNKSHVNVRGTCTVPNPSISTLTCGTIQSNIHGLFIPVDVAGTDLGVFRSLASLKESGIAAGIGSWTDTAIHAELYKSTLVSGQILNFTLTRSNAQTVTKTCTVPN